MSKNLKLKKVNKSFVPEPISFSSDSYMRMNICERLPYLYEYVYFTYSYLAMYEWIMLNKIKCEIAFLGASWMYTNT